MSKNVLILSGSPRRGGNTDTLCDEFMKGALDSGNNVEKIFIRDKKIGYCLSCYYCEKHDGNCVQKDDMAEILDKIEKADVIVLSSPIYFYSVDAQLKTVIDRIVARWQRIKDKEFYYIMSCGDEDENAKEGTVKCFRGLLECLGGSKEMGMICAAGFYDSGAVKSTHYMKDAYNLGKSVK